MLDSAISLFNSHQWGSLLVLGTGLRQQKQKSNITLAEGLVNRMTGITDKKVGAKTGIGCDMSDTFGLSRVGRVFKYKDKEMT